MLWESKNAKVADLNKAFVAASYFKGSKSLQRWDFIKGAKPKSSRNVAAFSAFSLFLRILHFNAIDVVKMVHNFRPLVK